MAGCVSSITLYSAVQEIHNGIGGGGINNAFYLYMQGFCYQVQINKLVMLQQLSPISE